MSHFVFPLKLLVACLLVLTGFGALWGFRNRILIQSEPAPAEVAAKSAGVTDKPNMLEISAQARKNLGLVSKPVQPQDYWRTVQIPGEIVDQPGFSDRGVTSPAVGVVTAIHAFPGDVVRPGESLFSLRLFSEYLQSTQAELFKAKRETSILNTEIQRLKGLSQSGAVSQSRIIELQNDISRQQTLIQSARQDLLTRGLLPAQIDQVEQGTFVATVEVTAPPPRQNHAASADRQSAIELVVAESEDRTAGDVVYEVQELSVELGQQVQAGELMAQLANHQALYVVGHAFKHEAPYLEQAAQEQRSIDIEFAEDTDRHWPPGQTRFEIRHLSNSIDTDSRTFDFFIPLMNQSRSYERLGQTFIVWRFRPGQRARLHVPVEKLENVFVLPAAAVVREGPEAYVFQQNGDLFKRLPAHVLHEDRQRVVIANDGSIAPGTYLARGAAASLNRVLKTQAAGGAQPGVHVHADGTVHEAH